MLRKLFITLTLATLAMSLTACGSDGDGGGTKVPVTGLLQVSPHLLLDPGVTLSSPVEIKVIPENATNKALKFESADESVFTVDSNGIITTKPNNTGQDINAVLIITSLDNASITTQMPVLVRSTALGYNEVNNVWEIYNATGLKNFRDGVNNANASIYAKLTADIDLEDDEWIPIGTNVYNGTFDGNGKTISGLKVNDASANNQGLFAYNNGVIKNLGLIAPEITGKEGVGGIAGSSDGLILASYVTGGTITGENRIGGIVGSGSGIIIASYVSDGNISATDASASVGGIIGVSAGQLVTNYFNVTGVPNGIGAGANNSPSDINAKPVTNIVDKIGELNNTLKVHTHEYVVNGNTLALQQKATQPASLQLNSTGYYEVHNANDLRTVRDYININHAQYNNINIILMDDIDLEDVEWRPIGIVMGYHGTFDGNGKTIEGLRITNASANNQGLVTYSGGVIKNLGLIAPEISSADFVGAIVALNGGSIIASYVSGGNISATANVGGIAGNNVGSIIASYVSGGNISATANVGGIAGNNIGSIIASYVSGSNISASARVGGITGVSSGQLVANYFNVTGVTNGIGAGANNLPSDINAEPVTNIVDKIDELNNTLKAHTHEYVVNGNTLALQQKATQPAPLQLNGAGYYEVHNADDLRTVRDYININPIQYNSINIILMANIDLEDVEWIPIGIIMGYSGTFDGNGKTISGLKITNASANNQGLFAYNNGVIKNLGLIAPEITGKEGVGAIAALNTGSIIASYVSGGNISATANVGGIAGDNVGSIIASYVSGSNISASTRVGGITGVSSGQLVANYFNVTGVANGIGDDPSGLPSDINAEPVTNIIEKKDALNNILLANSHEYVVNGSTLALQQKATQPEMPQLNDIGFYKVGTAEELRLMASYININGQHNHIDIILTANIDLEDVEWIPMGITGYSGTFDGNGKTIEGLKITNASANNQGLFAYNNGLIINLGLIAPEIAGATNVGGIVGRNNAPIFASYVTGGTISGVSNVGGIAGQNNDSIFASYVTDGAISGDSNVGGIVGSNYGQIISTYASGTKPTITPVGITAGSIVGFNYGLLTYNYYQGTDVKGIGNLNVDIIDLAEDVTNIQGLNDKVETMNNNLFIPFIYQRGANQATDIPTLVKR